MIRVINYDSCDYNDYPDERRLTVIRVIKMIILMSED